MLAINLSIQGDTYTSQEPNSEILQRFQLLSSDVKGPISRRNTLDIRRLEPSIGLLQQCMPAQGHLAHVDAVVLHTQDAPLRGQLHAVDVDEAIQVFIRAG
jgi:hypothetical protein